MSEEQRQLNKLMKYKVMEIEDYALLDEKDEDKLLVKLQCAMKKSFKKQSTPINQRPLRGDSSLSHNRETEEEKYQKELWEAAKKFKNKDGSLMTRK